MQVESNSGFTYRVEQEDLEKCLNREKNFGLNLYLKSISFIRSL